MSVETVPKDLRQLRACLVCSLVKTLDQFESDGCDNCETVLHLKRNRDNVYDCTSANFEGMIASCKPEDSWVCRLGSSKQTRTNKLIILKNNYFLFHFYFYFCFFRWQKISKLNKGVYAISVQGRLPPSVIRELRGAGINYKSRDTSKR